VKKLTKSFTSFIRSLRFAPLRLCVKRTIWNKEKTVASSTTKTKRGIVLGHRAAQCFHGECAHAAGDGADHRQYRPIEKFFTQETQRIAVSSALTFVKLATAFDIICSVEGAG